MAKKTDLEGFSEDRNEGRPWLSLREAEGIFGVPRRTLAGQILRGDLPKDAIIKVGREWRIHKRLLEDHFKRAGRVGVRGY